MENGCFRVYLKHNKRIYQAERLTNFNYWARLLAFLSALFGLAPVGLDDGDTCEYLILVPLFVLLLWSHRGPVPLHRGAAPTAVARVWGRFRLVTGAQQSNKGCSVRVLRRRPSQTSQEQLQALDGTA